MTAVATLDAPTPRPSDTDAASAAAGDRAAFERLYRTHVDRVFSLCARMVADRARAEELTQDVFVRAWEKLHLFRGDSAFSTWLHRLAVNVVLNDRKKRARRHARFEEEDETLGMDVHAGPERPTVQPGDMLDLEHAMTRLPPGARRVFTLHDIEGYKHEEIAELLGVTTGATKAQLHRARLLLRRELMR
jgi:RNA polymerase sigma-70 factor (ECF subfamily)